MQTVIAFVQLIGCGDLLFYVLRALIGELIINIMYRGEGCFDDLVQKKGMQTEKR